MEKLSSFDRVVGKVSETEKEHILEQAAERFDDQVFDNLKGKERKKTEAELQVITLANELTNNLRRQYGLEDFDIPSQNIHVISEEAWELCVYADSSAVYAPSQQAIAAREQPANIVFMKKTLHELLHFKSYGALQVPVDQSKVDEYRIGLIVHTRDGKTEYFKNLNEAVTEELTKRLLSIVQDHPLFTSEIEQSRNIRDRYPDALGKNGPLFNSDTFYAEVQGKKSWGEAVGRMFGFPEPIKKISVERFTYVTERRIFNLLMDKLFEKNKEQFSDREAVFHVFAKGMMTGNLLEIGRLVDGTFGIGTLRDIGELDDNINEQIRYVESL
jgi:hypothetical protein